MRVYSKNRFRFTNDTPDDFFELEPGLFQDVPAKWEGIKDTEFFKSALRDGSIMVLDSTVIQRAQEKELGNTPSYAEVMEQMAAQEASIEKEVQAQLGTKPDEPPSVDEGAADDNAKTGAPRRQKVV